MKREKSQDGPQASGLRRSQVPGLKGLPATSVETPHSASWALRSATC